MDIVFRSLEDEACDLEAELLGDLAGTLVEIKRKDLCVRATWCLLAGYTVGSLMRPCNKIG